MSIRIATTATRWRRIENAIAPFILREHDDGTISTDWMYSSTGESPGNEDTELRPEIVDRLDRYFAGEVAIAFEDIESPGPSFHRACRDACRRIPPGETMSYGELALHAGGRSGGARAAGQAMRLNPLCVIIPCHRVVAASGRLHGYGGDTDDQSEALRIKQALLEHERRNA
ncbi:MAG: methylated-DNA--[protein]-cysteine S-methyltransferase [Phycisphaerales bacterium]